MLAMGMMLGGGQTRYAVTLATNGGEFVLSTEAALRGWNLDQVVEITITLSSGIERRSTTTTYGGLHLNGLHPGSQVNVINRGYIIGVGESGEDGAGAAIVADFNGRLVLTNGSGYIWGGDPDGYAIRHLAATTLTWISGSTRISGAVGV